MVPRSRAPGNLFNGKIAPLAGYAIKGAIWYQGESNAFTVDGGEFYAEQLPLLVKDWRGHWGQGDFPFAWVQLPNFEQTSPRHPTCSRWWPRCHAPGLCRHPALW